MKHKELITLNNKDNITVKKWRTIKDWLLKVIQNETDKSLGFLNYTLVTDKELLKINIERLGHDFYTDIITFDLSDKNGPIEGDIYISYERIAENSRMFHVKRMEEMRRVIVHGLLHLLGYSDKTKKQKQEMKEKEDLYLNLYDTNY